MNGLGSPLDPRAVARAIWSIANPQGEQPRYDAEWMYAELGVPKLGGGRFEPGTGQGTGATRWAHSLADPRAARGSA